MPNYHQFTTPAAGSFILTAATASQSTPYSETFNPQAPSNVVVTLSGTEMVGQTLTAAATADGDPTIVFTYQWSYNGGADRPGATASTYVLVSADEGLVLKCTVTANNGVTPNATGSAITGTIAPSGTAWGPVVSSGTAATLGSFSAGQYDGTTTFDNLGLIQITTTNSSDTISFFFQTTIARDEFKTAADFTLNGTALAVSADTNWIEMNSTSSGYGLQYVNASVCAAWTTAFVTTSVSGTYNSNASTFSTAFQELTFSLSADAGTPTVWNNNSVLSSNTGPSYISGGISRISNGPRLGNGDLSYRDGAQNGSAFINAERAWGGNAGKQCGLYHGSLNVSTKVGSDARSIVGYPGYISTQNSYNNWGSNNQDSWVRSGPNIDWSNKGGQDAVIRVRDNGYSSTRILSFTATSASDGYIPHVNVAGSPYWNFRSVVNGLYVRPTGTSATLYTATGSSMGQAIGGITAWVRSTGATLQLWNRDTNTTSSDLTLVYDIPGAGSTAQLMGMPNLTLNHRYELRYTLPVAVSLGSIATTGTANQFGSFTSLQTEGDTIFDSIGLTQLTTTNSSNATTFFFHTALARDEFKAFSSFRIGGLFFRPAIQSGNWIELNVDTVGFGLQYTSGAFADTLTALMVPSGASLACSYTGTSTFSTLEQSFTWTLGGPIGGTWDQSAAISSVVGSETINSSRTSSLFVGTGPRYWWGGTAADWGATFASSKWPLPSLTGGVSNNATRLGGWYGEQFSVRMRNRSKTGANADWTIFDPLKDFPNSVGSTDYSNMGQMTSSWIKSGPTQGVGFNNTWLGGDLIDTEIRDGSWESTRLMTFTYDGDGSTNDYVGHVASDGSIMMTGRNLTQSIYVVPGGNRIQVYFKDTSYAGGFASFMEHTDNTIELWNRDKNTVHAAGGWAASGFQPPSPLATGETCNISFEPNPPAGGVSIFIPGDRYELRYTSSVGYKNAMRQIPGGDYWVVPGGVTNSGYVQGDNPLETTSTWPIFYMNTGAAGTAIVTPSNGTITMSGNQYSFLLKSAYNEINNPYKYVARWCAGNGGYNNADADGWVIYTTEAVPGTWDSARQIFAPLETQAGVITGSTGPGLAPYFAPSGQADNIYFFFNTYTVGQVQNWDAWDGTTTP